jgi:hypothetical protein
MSGQGRNHPPALKIDEVDLPAIQPDMEGAEIQTEDSSRNVVTGGLRKLRHTLT